MNPAMTHVLLIDDQLDVHKLVEHHLVKKLDGPVELTVACDEREAVAAVTRAEFDVVLLDLMLPDFTGLELMGKLLAIRPGLAVVVVSGRGCEQTVVEALERGAMSYVDKGVLARALAPTVRKVVAAGREDAMRRRVHSGLTSVRYSYEMENDPALISPLLDEVRDVFVRFSIGGANPAQMLIGIEEAIANAMYHGNLEIGSELKHHDFKAFYVQAQQARTDPRLADRKVRLMLEVRDGNAWVTVSDDGKGFDPAAVPDPTLPENIAKAHGRGLLLMRAFFDDVVFNESGTEVTLVAAAMPEGDYVAPDRPITKPSERSNAA